LFSSGDSNTQTTNIIFLGDSITRGTTGFAYLDKLTDQGEPWDNSNFNIVNSGLNQEELANYYENENRLRDRVFDHNPQFLYIFLGSVDLPVSSSVEYERNYRWVIETILDINSTENFNLKQVILVQFPWIQNQLNSSYLKVPEFFEIIANLTKEFDFGLVNLWNVTTDHPEYFVDHVHPSQLGAGIIASEIHRQSSAEIFQVYESMQTSSTEIQTTTTGDGNTTSDNPLTSTNEETTYVFIFLAILPVLTRFRKKQ